MKDNKSSVYLSITGLSLGLIGTLAGITFSSAIPATPSTYGVITATWVAISAAIVAGIIKPKAKETKEI